MADKSYSASIIFRGVDQLTGVMNRMAKNAKAVADKMNYAGMTMSKYFTAPLVALAGYAVKAAIDSETAFTGMIKTINAAPPVLNKLKKEFQDMSLRIPITANSLFSIGEAAGQLGIKVENIASFTEVMAKLGVTTNLTAEDAANMLARFANITQMPQTEFGRLGSVIVELGNRMATTEAEIVEMAMRLAGAGKQIGLAEPEIMAFAAALSSVGIEAEAGGTAFSRVMIKMQDAIFKGGKDLATFSKTAGISAADFKKKFKDDAGAALILFVEGLKRLKEEGKNVNDTLTLLGMEDIRVRDSLLRASGSGKLFRDALKLANDEWESNNALNREAALRFGTTASKLRMFMNHITITAVRIGDKLIPVILKLTKELNPLVFQIRTMDDSTLGMYLRIGALVAIVGPLLLALGAIAGAIRNIGAASVAVVGAVKFLAGTMILLDVAFLGVIAAAVLWVYKWNEIMAGFAALKDIRDVSRGFKEAWVEAFGFGEDPIQWWIDRWAAAKIAVPEIIEGMKSEIQEKWTNLVDIIKNPWENLVSFFEGVWNRVVGVFDRAVAKVQGYAGKIGAIGDNLGTVFGGGGDIDGTKALGGPVSRGGRYLVGERGPEIFNAPSAGSITPNGAFGSGGRSETDVTLRISPSPEFIARLERIDRRKGNSNVNVASDIYGGARI